MVQLSRGKQDSVQLNRDVLIEQSKILQYLRVEFSALLSPIYIKI